MNSKDYSGIAAAYSSIYADPYLEAKTDVKSILESLYVFETSEETEHFVEDLFTEDAEAIEFVLELYTITEESGFLLTEDVQNLQEDVENLHEILGVLKRVGAKVASKAGPALSKVTGAVKSGVGKVVQKGKDLVNRAAVAYGNRAGLNVVSPKSGKTLKAGQNLGLTQGSAAGRQAMRDAVVKDVKGKISGAVNRVKGAVKGALKNPIVRNVAKAALPVGAAVAGIAALNNSGVKPSSSRGEGRAADSPAAPKKPTEDIFTSTPPGGKPHGNAAKPEPKPAPKKPTEDIFTSTPPGGKPHGNAAKPEPKPAPKKPTVRTNNINLPNDTKKTGELNLPSTRKRESWRRPKAELEQIRGNAALQSISQSPNAERILKGKKGREALERSSAMLRKESTSKTVMGIAEAYASIYEKKSDCVDKKDKGAHNCAKKVCHEEYGEGETIFGQHAVPDENGFVSHYDVQFEHGIVENVSVEEMEVLTMEGHMKHAEHAEHEGEMISEEEVDVFDIIKGHLIDEGYADSEESALAIMANMTEEQRTEIIEGCK